MPTVDLSDPRYKGKLTPDEEDELIRLTQKLNKPTKEEEKEIVDFLVELIPVLGDIYIDLEKKNLLPDELCKKPRKKRKFSTS